MEPACEETEIELLLEEAGGDPAISSLDEKLTGLLYTMVNTSDELPFRSAEEEYLLARQALLKAYSEKLGEEKAGLIGRYMDRTETVEGTARYVEFKTAEALKDDKLKQQYLTGLKENVNGKEKYYRSGMAICLLLDRYYPDWKRYVFAGPVSPAALLEKSAKER
jgi:hypothetical protein